MNPSCPACQERGAHYEEDQYHCQTPGCRVVVFHGYGQTGGLTR